MRETKQTNTGSIHHRGRGLPLRRRRPLVRGERRVRYRQRNRLRGERLPGDGGLHKQLLSDDPTIFAWELANEPRAGGSGTAADFDAWSADISTCIKSIDSNHMVMTGLVGLYAPDHAGRSTNCFIADHRGAVRKMRRWHTLASGRFSAQAELNQFLADKMEA